MVFQPRYLNQHPRQNNFQSNYNYGYRTPPVYNQEKQGTNSLIDRFNRAKPNLISMTNKGVNGISKTLTNTQQILKVVETTAPIVQQYGPVIKNLPMIFKMLKAFNESEASDESQVDLQEQNDGDDINDDEDFDYGYNEYSYQSDQPAPKLFI